VSVLQNVSTTAKQQIHVTCSVQRHSWNYPQAGCLAFNNSIQITTRFFDKTQRLQSITVWTMPKKLRDQAVQSADDTKHPQRVLNGDNGGSRTAGGPSR